MALADVSRSAPEAPPLVPFRRGRYIHLHHADCGMPIFAGLARDFMADFTPTRTFLEASWRHSGGTRMNHDIVIIGGGPAAHNAALALGRARRHVLVCDEGQPRNRVAHHSHTFFTRDGTPPLELRRIAAGQLEPYETVELRRDRVTDVERIDGGFHVSFEGQEPVTTALVLLAVGVEDEHPDIAGFDELWGDTVIHCPYCHGWEVRDRPWAAYLTRVEPLVNVAKLRSWSDDVIVIVREDVDLPDETRNGIADLGFRLETGTVRALHAEDGELAAIELADGRRIPRKVLLHAPPQRQTALVRSLDLELDDAGYVVTDDSGQTSAPGIWAAGDLGSPRQQIAFAAAAGLRTAIAMDGTLATSSPSSRGS